MTPYRRALAVAALVLGALAAIVRTPAPPGPSVDVAALARAVEREDDHVTAVELAAWIKDRKPGLRVIDVGRAAEFDNYHVPTAERIALDALVTAPFSDQETIVLYSAGGAHAERVFAEATIRGNPDRHFEGGVVDDLHLLDGDTGVVDEDFLCVGQPPAAEGEHRVGASPDTGRPFCTNGGADARRGRGGRAHAEARMLTARVTCDESYFDELRAREFSRLARTGNAYLDYTGSALYADSQVRAHAALMSDGLFGNPHSEIR